MDLVALQPIAEPTYPAHPAHPSHLDHLIDKYDQIIQNYWLKYPELYQKVQQAKQLAAANEAPEVSSEVLPENSTIAMPASSADLLLRQPLRGARLRAVIKAKHTIIRQRVTELDAEIVPRTQANNRKNPYETIEEERTYRAEVLAAQIKSWRSLLPSLIKKFAKIPDYRQPGSIKHQITVLMLFGLFAFVLKLSSRREMNRALTSPVIFEHLKKIFPEIETIPHADTLARLLENINPQDIEAAHIHFLKELINKKKFKKLLIQDCLPVTIDGTQKLYREGLLQDPLWCERTVGKSEDNNKQQYIYVVEANITLKNGLTIPLMTEYLYRENNELLQTNDEKQDSETTAFERLAERLKHYFPRLKLIFFMDAMYATQPVMGMLHNYHWDFLIRLPKKKLTDFAKQLNHYKSTAIPIPNQPAYRKRKQQFYWCNNITYGYEWELTIHLIACQEEYDGVDKKTGEIIPCFSEHAWISSIPMSIDKTHELLNLGARKKELIEDSMNTEKNRGYHYKHAFSYNWNAMRGFHYLMRLGHAINAISEFTKKLKKYVKELGCSATHKLIK